MKKYAIKQIQQNVLEDGVHRAILPTFFVFETFLTVILQASYYFLHLLRKLGHRGVNLT